MRGKIIMPTGNQRNSAGCRWRQNRRTGPLYALRRRLISPEIPGPFYRVAGYLLDSHCYNLLCRGIAYSAAAFCPTVPVRIYSFSIFTLNSGHHLGSRFSLCSQVTLPQPMQIPNTKSLVASISSSIICCTSRVITPHKSPPSAMVPVTLVYRILWQCESSRYPASRNQWPERPESAPADYGLMRPATTG